MDPVSNIDKTHPAHIKQVLDGYPSVIRLPQPPINDDRVIDLPPTAVRASAPIISTTTLRDMALHKTALHTSDGASYYIPHRNLTVAKYILDGTRESLPIEMITIGMGQFQKGFMCSLMHEALKAGVPGTGAVCALSMRSSLQSLADQDNLFVVNTRTHGDSQFEVIGSIRESLCLQDPAARQQVMQRFLDPNVRTVAIVVTHGGYHLNLHGYLDSDSEEIKRDLENPMEPSTVEGLLVEALRLRFESLKPREAKLLILPCDNVPAVRDPSSNDWRGLGEMLHESLVEYAYASDNVELATHIRDYVSIPNTMIDRICPKPTSRQEADLTQTCGIQDSHLVVTEPLPTPALIIERHRKGSPPLIDYNHKLPYSSHPSVRIEDQANGWRDMKTYTLNTAHVMVAWIGKYLGLDDSTADSIMESRSISQFIEDTLTTCVKPVMDPSLFDDSCTYEQYMRECLHRVRNHSLPDTLDRLDTKGTEKICERVMAIVVRNERHLRELKEAYPDAQPILAKELERLALFVALWAKCVTSGVDENDRPVRIHQDKKALMWKDPKYGDLSSDSQVEAFLQNKSIFNASPTELPNFVKGFKQWILALPHLRLEEIFEHFNSNGHLHESSGLGSDVTSWVI